MIKDIHFSFVGFHGTDGYCHLRVAQKSSTKKMVIVCSQYRNYYGTSPTNAMEIIAEKFFYDVANKNIEGFDLPKIITYEEWHQDVNSLDKLLVKTNPEKYKKRFKNTFLDVPKMFKEIVWIERYPAGTGLWDHEDGFSLVSMGDQKDPHWHGKPTDDFIISKTGFSISELFADPEVLDLKEVQKDIEEMDEAKIFLSNHVNRSVRWSTHLIEQLPPKIKVAKFSTGRGNNEDLWELQIQGLIEEIFSICFPASDLFESEFKISKRLGIHKSGSEKKCDVVVFQPESNKPSVMIELKRACSTVKNQSGAICQDIAKLLVYSQIFESDSYLLVCGEKEELLTMSSSLGVLLSFDNDYECIDKIDKSNSIDKLSLTQEYQELLNNFGVNSVHTRLIGISDDYTVALWQISHLHSKLINNKPYLYRLVNPSNEKG
ncbi:hypothetical protein HYO05_22995 [Vibrio parahaemolyticus]|uniref:hypothetical protein n=1 Tax=Vibrio harveyi group TaxID=717610 RepID=UPI00084A3C51|nr:MULTISPECIES: hypothetical protein [Vibrio harveyi group]ELA9316621.1 hypothetical protein [Vibrio parahaemolyticus]ELA9340921.1 hypothetical protein [Vibrio parahaemolyticus]ELP9500676.1 hypothetical protein [Vibrio alginolyticus]MBM5036920.1 hypothetical protein [Vibrio parahaemolyticus]MBM5050634.1 hypothetical protein [Vibrio parahaemolyticus]